MKVLFLSILSVLILCETNAQQPYTIRQDPGDPKRKIIDLKPAVRKASTIISLKNILNVNTGRPRPALEFKPFEMRNPKNGRALNPDEKMTIKFNDSVSKTMTVGEYYQELNSMEQSACNNGRTLRVPSTFADLRPNFNPSAYYKDAKLGSGFLNTNFKTGTKPQPKYNVKTGLPLQTKFTPNVGFNIFKVMQWEPKLYIADRYENQGSPEFPVKWVAQTNVSPGRKLFPMIVEVPKGFEGLVKRIYWQVSTQPFDENLVDINVPGVFQDGNIYNPGFTQALLGVDILPNSKNNTFAFFTIDLSLRSGPNGTVMAPPAAPLTFYIRSIEYDAAGEIIRISPQVVAIYGGTPKNLQVLWHETNTVPGFNYSYPPDESVPFGIFLRGEGFNTYRHNYFKTPEDTKMTMDGFRFRASATLGIRYFNFMSIVNPDQPKSKELKVIQANFVAGAGLGIPAGDMGVKLKLDILEGFAKPEIDFQAQVPGSLVVPINHTIEQKMDWELLSTRFFIGPVPFRITAKIGGKAGVHLGGQINTQTLDFQGSIEPFISTYFTASGGVDAVIAYATLNAEINPLLELGIPVTFSTSGKALTFSNNISGLYGRVYLAVGFYYPCPSLEKIVGFLTGDEKLPLCECKWEWDIFKFDGFEKSFPYESK